VKIHRLHHYVRISPMGTNFVVQTQVMGRTHMRRASLPTVREWWEYNAADLTFKEAFGNAFARGWILVANTRLLC
jgi:hypothetical protein